MNYDQIKTAAIDYADRKDAATAARMDTFLLMVEAQINRRLRTGAASRRATIPTKEGEEYFGLPSDFAGLRDIEVAPSGDSGDRVTPRYVSPEIMNSAVREGSSLLMYTIIANQIQINPTATGSVLEIVYYSKVTPLSQQVPETWLSVSAPDVYVFGLLVEISAFAKDADAAALWAQRFTQELTQIQNIDDVDRWSGPPLQIQIG